MKPEKNNNPKGKPKPNNQKPQNGKNNGNGRPQRITRCGFARPKTGCARRQPYRNQYMDASSKQMDITAPNTNRRANKIDDSPR
jgi:hypothetical protein